MTGYFFDLSDGAWEPDRVGTELADDAAARREAIRYLGEVLRFEPHRLDEGRLRVKVHDGNLSVSFWIEVSLKQGG